MKKPMLYILFGFLLLLMLGAIIYILKVKIEPPITNEPTTKTEVQFIHPGWKIDDGNSLIKNPYGIWELRLSGSPEHIGHCFGALTNQAGLFEKQEEAFVSEIKNRMPSSSYLTFIKYLVGWFNRDLEHYVPVEYQKEIYASSKYMSDKFDDIAPKYHRGLNYHAAHDIGHALQNMNLVGCTSFGLWDDKVEDHGMVIGRNFDFYFGQEFAKDKIVAFFQPDSGYAFASVTWACFSGVVSGINEKGLTITLNAAKSDIPTKAKSPVSLIAREVLQYASNIEEAHQIILRHESFVAETFLIGSRLDSTVQLIEKSPDTTAIYEGTNSQIVATNHFQSNALLNNRNNQEYLSEGVSDYRHRHVRNLINAAPNINVKEAVNILRNKSGLNNEFIGYGNEKSIDQLIAHHGIVFAPLKNSFWVSAAPYVLGQFVAYNLDDVWQNRATTEGVPILAIDSLSIESDTTFLKHKFADYQTFLRIKEKLIKILFVDDDQRLSTEEIDFMIESNPESYQPFYYLGQYYIMLKEWNKAHSMLLKGLEKVASKKNEVAHMHSLLEETNKMLNQ